MITAVDSSVLLAIFNAETDADRWLDALVRARREGRLVICEIVYAEIGPAFGERASLDERLDSMGVSLLSLNAEAAWTAGMTFRQYRESGGPRERLIPDFLIAAHALVQTNRLAAIDRGYLRRWFKKLPILSPP